MKTSLSTLFPKLGIFASLSVFVFATVFLAGCSKKVSRVDPDSVMDLSGNWNNTDSRLVAEKMLNECLTANWYQESVKNGEKPVITIGDIRNLSSEHINTSTFMNDIQRVLINSGKVKFVANSEVREKLRSEIDDQKGNATDETAKERGQETGADIMLSGTINTIVDQSGGETVKFYQIDLMLNRIQSTEYLWIGNEKIKKHIEKSALKF